MAQIDSFILRELQFDLDSADLATRRHAIISLSRQEPCKELLELLKKVAEGDKAEECRYLAKKFYGEFRAKLQPEIERDTRAVVTDGTVDLAVFRAFLDGADTPAKIEAVKLAAETKDHGALPLVLGRLKDETDTWVLATLVKAVGTLGDASNVPLVQGYLKHGDARVQANAIEALESIGGDLVFPLLQPMLNEKDNRIRANAIKALVRFDRDEALNVLEKMASSPKLWMRDSAAYCLEQVDDPRGEGILCSMLEAETAQDLMKKEAEILAAKGTRQAIGPLRRLLELAGRDKVIVVKFALAEVAARAGADEAEQARLGREYAASRPSSAPASAAAPEAPPEAQDTAGAPRSRLPTVRMRRPLAGALGTPEAPPTKTGTASHQNRLTVVLLSAAFVAAMWGVFLREPGSALPGVDRARGSLPGTGGPARGSTLRVREKLCFIDQRERTLLVNHQGRPVLFKVAEAPWDKLRVGDLVELEGEVTGRTRFGATYARGTAVRPMPR